MGRKSCKLYDEYLVRNIMLSTGLSVYQYFKGRKKIAPEEICDYVDSHAGSIIRDTLDDISRHPFDREHEAIDKPPEHEEW